MQAGGQGRIDHCLIQKLALAILSRPAFLAFIYNLVPPVVCNSRHHSTVRCGSSIKQTRRRKILPPDF